MMKKIIFSLAILMATSISGFAISSNQNPNANTGATTCNTKCEKSKDKKDKKEKGKHHKGGFGKRGLQADLFEGLNLTSEQQVKIAELQKSLRPEKVVSNEDAKLTEEQKKSLRKERLDKMEKSKEEFLKGVKNILTPEQYLQFLENSYLRQNDLGMLQPKSAKKISGEKKDGIKKPHKKDKQ